MTRRGVPALFALLLVAVLFGGSSATGQAATSTSGTNNTSDRTSTVMVTSPKTYKNQAVRATNRHRADEDRKRLRSQDCLKRMARNHARRMASQRRMFHQDLGRVMSECHLTMVGENVAYGYPSGRSVVNRGWMHSDGHRANILQRRYRLIGVAARKGDGRWYVAQVFGRR
ncbi:CAP domain-containing protein [Nocardioides sp. JQ2195]|uniref:CAP domain-containing protein n=1 Tax=Nocardioides sp. JQ2195 TaxID=2592334 RepID=UPI00143EC2AA|nr:CAP domain-containing protein [Nocardioides sp. JQ2195]QIX25974.1 CAP domain-containing protein [Nocardioides sp. JQ2195]